MSKAKKEVSEKDENIKKSKSKTKDQNKKSNTSSKKNNKEKSVSNSKTKKTTKSTRKSLAENKKNIGTTKRSTQKQNKDNLKKNNKVVKGNLENNNSILVDNKLDVDKVDNYSIDNDDTLVVVNSKIIASNKKEDDELDKTITMFLEDSTSNKKKYIFKKFSFDIFDILIIVVVVAIVSCVFTGLVLNYQYKKDNYLKNSNLPENVVEFVDTYNEIMNNYYEEVDGKKLTDAAINGMIDYLEDNYSIYFNSDETDNVEKSLGSKYEGIGVLIAGNTVYMVYKNSPAEFAGIMVGDVISSVNGVAVSGDDSTDVSSLIKDGEKNKLVIIRDGKSLDFEVEKAEVVIPTVNDGIIENRNGNIGYIVLSSFASNTYEEFVESLLKLEKESNIKALIIDLRNNGGGYLDISTQIASLFIEKDKLLYSLEKKDGKIDYKDKDNESRDYPVVVLTNGITASASEVLAAALKDSYGATIVGEKTFGKGKVQTIKYFEGKMLKYTSAKWFRPNGECVDEIGINPDVLVERKNNTLDDEQLNKAIELLK